MTSFEQTLLQEVAALPKSRRADVLAFVHYLRISLMDDNEPERRYGTAIEKPAKRQNAMTFPKKMLKKKFGQ